MSDIDNKRVIELNEFELNLIHGLLVNEENNVNEVTKKLIEEGGHYNNFKYYVDSLKDLRRRFTQMDDTEDFCGAFERLETFKLDADQNIQEQLKVREMTTIEEFYEILDKAEKANEK